MSGSLGEVVLGIDLGTSSAKVVLATPRGDLLAQSTRGYPVARPHPGWAETDPGQWWTAIVDAVHEVTRARPDATVRGIGFSGQMHGVVLADQAGQPVRPAVLWEDARAEAELDLYRRLDPVPARRLANPLSPGMAGPVLAWLHRHEPEVTARAAVAVQPKDWVRGRLTGRWNAEPSDASATLLYDVLGQSWDLEIASALGISAHLLAPILDSAATRAGSLQTSAAAELGLEPGLPVAAGAADTAAAALGSGLIDPGVVQLTIGTGVQIVTPAPQPAADSLRAPQDTVTHLYRSATAHGWYAMAAGLTGGVTLGWVRGVLAADWPELYGAAEHSCRADDPIFLPHVAGERTPYLDTSLRAAWTGLEARHERGTLLYAALEGVAFAVADGFDALCAAVGGRPRTVWLAGGGTTSPAWRQLLADVLQMELHAVAVPGASARGAALLAAQAAGLLSDAELAEVTTPVTRLAAAPRADDGVLRERRAKFLDVLGRLRS